MTTLLPKDISVISQLISNIDEKNQKIPFLTDILQHPIYKPLFTSLDEEDKQLIQQVLDEYISVKINNLTTKGGQLFRRFVENNQQLFDEFRALNEFPHLTSDPQFQQLGKHIEQEMFKLENILTSRMMRKSQGLNKTIEAFYTLIYSFFPLYGAIES